MVRRLGSAVPSLVAMVHLFRAFDVHVRIPVALDCERHASSWHRCAQGARDITCAQLTDRHTGPNNQPIGTHEALDDRPPGHDAAQGRPKGQPVVPLPSRR